MERMKFETPDMMAKNAEEIAALQTRIPKEKQMNRQMELNAEVKRLRKELENAQYDRR